MATQTSVRESNAALLSDLESGQVKRAENSVTSFTRIKMRENSYSRRLLPPVTVTNDDLNRVHWTDKPIIIVDKENDVPAAVSVPFGQSPSAIYIKAPRYPVQFERILSPRFIKDIDELRTYHMDVRQVMSDNSLKDMLSEEDAKWMVAIHNALGTLDANHPLSGVPQYRTLTGGITRKTVPEALKIMSRTPFQLAPEVCLTNVVTWLEFMKWGRDEVGDDLAGKIIRDGMQEETWLGKKWVVTIKRDLVPDDRIYMLASPEFIGKNFLLEDVSMVIKRDGPMIEWYNYQTHGAALGHSGGVAAAIFS
jgi:ferritin-like protein